MSKEKQIEEMANDLAQHCPDLVANCCGASSCVSCLTRFLYEAGYRKQSEWISVEERLPETDTRVLVYMHENRMSYTKIDTDRIVARKWVRWGDLVTHWMPLPDAPKGGAE